MASVKKQRKQSTCFVPLCISGYHSNRENVSLFKAPTDPSRLSECERRIKRADRKLTPNVVVCEKHFADSCIERSFKITVNGVVNEILRDKLRLKPDAVSTKFEGYPVHLIPKVASKRKVRDLCQKEPVAKRSRRTAETLDEETTEIAAAPQGDKSFDIPKPLGENQAAPQPPILSEGRHPYDAILIPATWMKLSTAPADTLTCVRRETQANDFSHLFIKRMIQFAKPLPRSLHSSAKISYTKGVCRALL